MSEREKADLVVYCNTCGRDTNHENLYTHCHPWEQSFDGHLVEGSVDHSMLRCRGCDAITIQRSSWDSESCVGDDSFEPDVSYIPARTERRMPRWANTDTVPEHVRKLTHEIYNAVSVGALMLAAMGVRSLLEHMMIKVVKDHGSFADNLAAFEKDGHISRRQREVLERTLDVGHATMHRSYVPDNAALNTSLDVAEHLVDAVFVLPKSSRRLARGVPKRRRRKSKSIVTKP